MTYISSMSLSSPLRLSTLQAQSALAQAQTEVSTGVHADLGLALGARTGLAVSLKSEADQLGGYLVTNSLADTRLSATSNALDAILSSAQSLSASLVAAATAGGSTTSATPSAEAALRALITGLNTSSGGQYVFAGINTDASPMDDYFGGSASSKQTVDQAFQNAFGTSQTSAGASSISGDDMAAFLDNQFDALFSDSGWQRNWSSASDATMQTQIAPSQSVSTSVSANEAAFRQLTAAYAMVTEFTGQNLSEGARSAVIAKATTVLGNAIASLTSVQAGVGVAQSSIDGSNVRISAQIDTLKSSVSNLESVDPYELSTKITTLQTQIQASYQLTSRLQSLSLVNYL